MHPNLLVEMLATYLPGDDRESADLLRMRVFAGDLADPFSRRSVPAHFTGSAVVLDPSGERVCLIHHRKLDRWLQPGGHSEPADEGDLSRTALREAREETGLDVALVPGAPTPLDIDVHRIPARGDEPEHWHLDVRFLVRAREPAELAADKEETRDCRFFSFDEALARADEPAFTRLLVKARGAARVANERSAP